MATARLPLSPFAHELNTSGTACAADCPACRWINLRNHKEQFLEFVLRRAHRLSFAVLLCVLGFSASAHAQKGFNTVIPDRPITIQDHSTYVYTSGHWIALDKKSELTGPSFSEITCNHRTCTEQQANMMVDGDAFSLSADSLEYKVTRWNRKEIVATNIDGICRVLNVLNFDLVQKRVYLSQTLSEPTNDLPKLSRELCSSVGMNLELKAATMWKAERAKRDLHQP